MLSSRLMQAEGPTKSKERAHRDMASTSVWSTPEDSVTVPVEKAVRRESHDTQMLVVGRLDPYPHDRWSRGRVFWWRRPFRIRY